MISDRVTFGFFFQVCVNVGVLDKGKQFYLQMKE